MANLTGLSQTVGAAEIGFEDELGLRPADHGVVEAEPGEAEKDRVLLEAGDVELDILSVRTDLESNRDGFEGDEAGGDGATIGDHSVQGLVFESEIDGVASRKIGVDTRGERARVDQGNGGDRSIAYHESYRKYEWSRESGRGTRWSRKQKRQVDRSGLTMAERE
jgi:hypothetical protein